MSNPAEYVPGPTGSVSTVRASDGYELRVRSWQPDEISTQQLLLLHGVVSHSEWLTPIGYRLAKMGVSVVCPDRRGAGLNQVNSGDAPSSDQLIDDIVTVAKETRSDGVKQHLAGFCWGCNPAIRAAEKNPDLWGSLILIAPSIFPARDLLEKEVVTGSSGEATQAPVVPLDRFTQGPAFKSYIIPDELKTTHLSPRFNGIMRDLSTMLAARWARIKLPTLVICASQDTLADVEKHKQAFATLRAKEKKLVCLPGAHGLQFEAPEETVVELSDWITRN